MSEEFFGGQECGIDAKIKVICDGREGDIINQYVIFTKVCKEQVALYGRSREAILETLRICRDRNVLKEYLESREKEVVDIMMALYDEEEVIERYVEDRENEAAIRSAVEMCQDLEVTINDAVAKIAAKFNLEWSKSAAKVNKYWKKYRLKFKMKGQFNLRFHFHPYASHLINAVLVFGCPCLNYSRNSTRNDILISSSPISA